MIIGEEEFHVKEGDVYVIEPGQKFCIKAEGLDILVTTRPDWYREQCEIVGE